MIQHIWHSVLFSLEWRAIAFVITGAFFWVTSGEFVRATVMAMTLQAILFVAHVVWFYFREEAYTKNVKS
jgi:hypothetical protein